MASTLTSSSQDSAQLGPSKPALPHRLEAGATMSASEFHQLYASYPDNTRFELIDGVVFMASPLHAPHARVSGTIVTLFGNYVAFTPGVDFGDNGSVRLDDLDEVQPDAHLRITQACGGQSQLLTDSSGAETIVRGAPELVAEVADSSRSIDFGAKLHAYRRAGVREYLVANLRDSVVKWFTLADMSEIVPDASGISRSLVMPGLWLDPAAILASDTKRLLDTIQAGTASEGHREFAAKLAAAKG